MPQDKLNFDYLKEEYVICSCEGSAELAIMKLLLEHDSLVFTIDNLVDREVSDKRKATDIQTAFLGRSYEKPVNILRILDSKRDFFELSFPYGEICSVHNIYTTPEIEMLLIFAEGAHSKYLRTKKHKHKPSEYCRSTLFRGEKIKNYDFVRNYFADINKLHNAIRLYHKHTSGKDGKAGLFHLLRASLRSSL